MKIKDFVKGLREKDSAELDAESKKISEEILKLRFRAAAGQTEHNQRIGELRRSLARVLTVKAEKLAVSNENSN